MPSYLTQLPSGFTCSLNYQITTAIHINTIYTLSPTCTSSSSIFDSSAPNSLFSDNVRVSHPFHTLSPSSLLLGLLLRRSPLSIPHHRRHSALYRIRAVALSRTALQRAALRPATLPSCSRCRRHLLLVCRSDHRPAGRLQHPPSESGHSTVHQPVHDERRCTAEQHSAQLRM